MVKNRARKKTNMKRVEFVYFSQDDVIKVGLTMGETISIVEIVLREHGLGRVENPPKPGIHPLANAFIHAMPGYLPGLQAAGMKWVSSFPGNVRHDLPAVMGLMVLNDVQTGQPLALMDCRWITAVRTGAVSGIAAKYLAKKHSSVIGVVGAGIQGRFNLLALKNVLPEIQQVKVFDINPKVLKNYIQQMSQVIKVQIEAVASPQDAIVGADVIVTATGRLEKPIYMERWVKEGALVLPIHHRGWENTLLQKADKFVCDDWLQLQQADRDVGGFDGPLPPLYGELGEIVLGRKAGRQSDQERIVDFNYGLSIEDVAVARTILEKGRVQKVGLVLTLCQGDLPLQ